MQQQVSPCSRLLDRSRLSGFTPPGARAVKFQSAPYSCGLDFTLVVGCSGLLLTIVVLLVLVVVVLLLLCLLLVVVIRSI